MSGDQPPRRAAEEVTTESKQSNGGRLLTADEVAELLGVPTTWVYEQSRLGRIPTVTLGRYRRYRREAIAAWLEGLESPASGTRAYARGR